MARKTGSVGAETARDVRDAALQLFARQGYAAVSMRQIAGEVGVQAGALYNHFPTKQDLLASLMTAHMQALLAEWESKQQEFGDPAEALEGFVRFHIRYHAERADEVFISYMELRNLDGANFRTVEKLRQNYERHLRAILEEGRARAIFAISDKPVTAMAIIAMLTGVTTWYRSGGRLSIREVEEIYVTMVLGSVGMHRREADI
ncbi:MAG: TetR/AcrR family transcriptional regulator [Nitratireductor sp.]